MWASDRLSECAAQVFPRSLGPVIRLREGEAGLDVMTWTLLPSWAAAPEWRKFRHNFNARAETIDTVPSFKSSMRSRRCLVPAAAFMEFPVLDGVKVKHRVGALGGEPMLLAGLWDRWTDGGREISTYTVITAEPHPGLRWLHRRIPVVLPPEAREVWLNPETSHAVAKALLVSPEPTALAATPC